MLSTVTGGSGMFPSAKRVINTPTAFCTPWGLFEINGVPFGIKNGPGEYQRAMNQVFGALLGQGVECYIDDTVIYADSPQECLELLNEVIRICIGDGFFLKLAKCEWLCEEIPLLGQEVWHQALAWKGGGVEQSRRQKTRSRLKSLSGLLLFHRRFVPGYSDKVQPLQELMNSQKTQSFTWRDSHEVAMRQVIEDLVNADYLVAADPDAELVLNTDANQYAVGVLLGQVNDHPRST
ncbi:putative Pol polyprotein [Gregarina niphandrodes]|uniref:Pol polyprotein n=2 Tax=Gregarina niphandrodes TaxID=110365 RepID=A0A023B8J4_GRENI|nr:putative Pol polyprotein [Gregarina niphandrodes]EZG69125.1 putative Pol polyprotein [Gregarina niphandrodes]|eukprot:XP_011134474.1 putative Pol polyprotein [Gregarina niphandrodes]